MKQLAAVKSEEKEVGIGNPMRRIRLEKITLNAGTGGDAQRIENTKKLFEKLTGSKPMIIITRKRTTFGVPKRKPISVMVSLRGKRANELLAKLLHAAENRIKPSQFDSEGNFSFGIEEYINIPGIKYDPDIGILGFDVAVTLERPGFRVKRRMVGKTPLGKKHKITREESMEWVSMNFNVKVSEEND